MTLRAEELKTLQLLLQATQQGHVVWEDAPDGATGQFGEETLTIKFQKFYLTDDYLFATFKGLGLHWGFAVGTETHDLLTQVLAAGLPRWEEWRTQGQMKTKRAQKMLEAAMKPAKKVHQAG